MILDFLSKLGSEVTALVGYVIDFFKSLIE